MRAFLPFSLVGEGPAMEGKGRCTTSQTVSEPPRRRGHKEELQRDFAFLRALCASAVISCPRDEIRPPEQQIREITRKECIQQRGNTSQAKALKNETSGVSADSGSLTGLPARPTADNSFGLLSSAFFACVPYASIRKQVGVMHGWLDARLETYYPADRLV